MEVETTSVEPTASASTPSPSVDEEYPAADSIERLAKLGDFSTFVHEAARGVAGSPADPRLQRLAAEALLAQGRCEDAQAMAARMARHATETEPLPLEVARAALRIEMAARLRGGHSLSAEPWDSLIERLPADCAEAAAWRYWHEELAGAAPYRLLVHQETTELPLVKARALSNRAGYELDGISAEANGVALPLVFIDTGAQRMLLSTAAAAAAHVECGPSGPELVGFSKTTARPGLIRSLRIGGLELQDVPVLVGDTASLSMAKGQGSLGIEVLHHLKLAIDYPARRVVVSTYDEDRLLPTAATSESGEWAAPLWTFSNACLTSAKLPGGEHARTLIDTGNRLGAFVSPRFAQRLLPSFQRPIRAWNSRLKPSAYEINGLQLAEQPLPAWPIWDVLPADLERLDVVDLLLGYDLLWQYRATIDLRSRRMILQGPSTGPRPEHEAVEAK